jgi:hypothetical protein
MSYFDQQLQVEALVNYFIMYLLYLLNILIFKNVINTLLIHIKILSLILIKITNEFFL